MKGNVFLFIAVFIGVIFINVDFKNKYIENIIFISFLCLTIYGLFFFIKKRIKR